MMRAFQSAVLALVATAASAAVAQFTPPAFTPRPAPPMEHGPTGPQALPAHTPVPPTRTPTLTPTRTPTPLPPDSRLAGPRWGTDQFLLPISIHRLDNPSGCKSGGDFLNGGGIRIFVDCASISYGLLGLRVDFDIWKGLRLKNGWKVKSLDMRWTTTEPSGPDSHHGFRVTKSPTVGSDNPETTVRLFAEPLKSIWVEGGLTIQGPHGTTPW